MQHQHPPQQFLIEQSIPFFFLTKRGNVSFLNHNKLEISREAIRKLNTLIIPLIASPYRHSDWIWSTHRRKTSGGYKTNASIEDLPSKFYYEFD